MTNIITERANKYADGKAYEAMTQAIAQAYEDGYQKGYEDGIAKVPVEQPVGKTEFVDLGLPSGTLWSADYEKVDDDFLYLPFAQANVLNIPTKEQWNELFQSCQQHCEYEYSGNSRFINQVVFVGPNGNILTINVTGKIDVYEQTDAHNVYFWLKEHEESNEKYCVNIYRDLRGSSWLEIYEVVKMFSGYKLPVRLVHNPKK